MKLHNFKVSSNSLFMCQDEDKNETESFRLFKTMPVTKTKPLVLHYIELLVRLSQVCFITYKSARKLWFWFSSSFFVLVDE